MAIPRIFVSSTCYDLGEIRDSLCSFITSLHYEAVLSERGDVFYHPDLHTQDSCIHEIENCHIFVLIIGGRFGGQYSADIRKSIVNAEYHAAKKCGIPVFCFVKNEVLQDSRVYEKNKDNAKLIKDIKFPSIDNKDNSIAIFEFINEVKKSPVNNGIFPFTFTKEIEEQLRKQWAGMMCDFLLKRQRQSELSITTSHLENLSLVGRKTEELLENIYKYLDEDNAPKTIERLDEELEATKFFQEVLKEFEMRTLFIPRAKFNDLMNVHDPIKWYDFLELTGLFEIERDELVHSIDKPPITMDFITPNIGGRCIAIGGDMDEDDHDTFNKMSGLFSLYQNLKTEQRLKVLANVFTIK